jgi:uncharacterized protein YdgA (DUF945 family)
MPDRQTRPSDGPSVFVLAIIAVGILVGLAIIWVGVWWYLSTRSSQEYRLRRVEEEIRTVFGKLEAVLE